MFNYIKTTKIKELLDHKTLTSDFNSIDYLKPKFIYIPLSNGKKYDSLVEVGEEVKVGQVVALSNDGLMIPMHSSVSGKVISLDKKMWTSSQEFSNCIVIENDYKEEWFGNNNSFILNKENLIDEIRRCGIVGMGGSGFPTYLKYNNSNLDTLIINGCECEPFITCDYRIILEQTFKLINGIKYALKATGCQKAVICLKEDKKDLIEILKSSLTENMSLLLVKDRYPVGWERFLVYKVKKRKYDKLPSEIGCVVSNVSTIVAIYDCIKIRKPLIERMVTFTGYCINRPINVNCKVGTDISEIIEYLGGYKHKYHRKSLIIGGVMTGKSFMYDNVVISKNTNAVIINPFIDGKNKEMECIGCGRCANVCPSKLTPTEIIKQFNKKNIEELDKLHALNCVECGLCSYICPSRIDLTFNMKKSKMYLMRGKNGK